MLSEITAGRQERNGLLRRWYQDDYFDLFVWRRVDGEIASFQLCYDRRHSERALSWSAERGYSHHRVDSGESAYLNHKESPLLRADGVFPVYRIAPHFESAAASLDPELKAFLLQTLLAYPRALYGPMRRPRRRRSLSRPT